MGDYVGYTSNHEMRLKLAYAAVKYIENEQYRAPLNEFIMEVQEPFIEIIAKMSAQLEKLNKLVEDIPKEAKERKKTAHNKARNERMKEKDNV